MLTVILCIAALGPIGAFMTWWGMRDDVKAVEARPKPKLSLVAKQLLKEYNDLPEDSRPWPDITIVLEALDRETSMDAVERTRHFDKNWIEILDKQGYGTRPSFTGWTKDRYEYDYCGHSERNCKFYRYMQLHQEMQKIQDEIEKRQRLELALKNQGVEADFNDLITGLRSERELQVNTSNELRKLL